MSVSADWLSSLRIAYKNHTLTRAPHPHMLFTASLQQSRETSTKNLPAVCRTWTKKQHVIWFWDLCTFPHCCTNSWCHLGPVSCCGCILPETVTRESPLPVTCEQSIIQFNDLDLHFFYSFLVAKWFIYDIFIIIIFCIITTNQNIQDYSYIYKKLKYVAI